MSDGTYIEALREAIKIAGSQNALATALGISQAHIWNWLNRDKLVPPAKYVLDIERVTGVSRHRLRPDLYPDETKEGR
jgi:DNA-binding transcriptional regulator YdaS (Cro superfamily)